MKRLPKSGVGLVQKYPQGVGWPMPMGTQLGTQWCLFWLITPGSIPQNIQESVVAKPLSGAPFSIG